MRIDLLLTCDNIECVNYRRIVANIVPTEIAYRKITWKDRKIRKKKFNTLKFYPRCYCQLDFRSKEQRIKEERRDYNG